MDGLIDNGKFQVGVNYWASHAGTMMWSKWDARIVEDDFIKLKQANVSFIRVFPLWSDFQPLTAHYSDHVYEYRIGEEPLPDNEFGRCGVSEMQMEHFRVFLDLAEKYELKIIVALITGHMSGKLFVPPAFEGKDVYKDPMILRWEIRYVEFFVRYFKYHKAIVAWDLGNECNNMHEVSSQGQAFVWAKLISNAIKSNDDTKPVISGINLLSVDEGDTTGMNSSLNAWYDRGCWTITDQAEATDILTTHLYHIFESNIDPINSIRAELHPVCETLMYQGISSKPCFLEEVGAIGYMNTSKKVEADFFRTISFSLWAHNCFGIGWWCAFDQGHLTQTPYDWNTIGSEYGFYNTQGQIKPVGVQAKAFMDFIHDFPFETLPKRMTDGVCIIPRGLGVSASKVAVNTFLLAKQAGIELEFQYSEQPLKDSDLYIMPSLLGNRFITKHRFSKLLEKVKNGATLYISTDECLIGKFTELTGLTVASRERSDKERLISLNGETYPVKGAYKYNIDDVSSIVLATDENGNPVFVCNNYGKGKIYCLMAPLESYLSKKCEAFHSENALPYCNFYKQLEYAGSNNKTVFSDNLQICVTEHPIDSERHIVIAINYSSSVQKASLSFKDGWEVSTVYYGSKEFEIPNNDAIVFLVQRHNR